MNEPEGVLLVYACEAGKLSVRAEENGCHWHGELHKCLGGLWPFLDIQLIVARRENQGVSVVYVDDATV